MITKKEKQRIAQLVTARKYDEILDAATFNQINSAVLMLAEIHQCMEDGKIDFVLPETSHSSRAAVDKTGNPMGGVELVEVDITDEEGKVIETKNVLILPPDTMYKEWRPIYDSLV